jgi:hypothetical protein
MNQPTTNADPLSIARRLTLESGAGFQAESIAAPEALEARAR